ncbi:hypothetical protein NRP93_001530 [Clostridium botulinum]|nr:hypothetical protein [Clostridium botulinum]
MKKYLIILSIMLMIFSVGCTNSKKTNADTSSNKDNVSSSHKTNDKSENLTETASSDSGTNTSKNNVSTLDKNKDNSKKVSQTTFSNCETNKNKSNVSNLNKSKNSSKKVTNSNSKIGINEKSLDKNSTFYFGMSKESVISKLNKLNLKVENEIEITTSDNDPEWGNKQIWSNNISFSFDKNNKLYAINIKKNIPTSLGLKIGDSVEKLEI